MLGASGRRGQAGGQACMPGASRRACWGRAVKKGASACFRKKAGQKTVECVLPGVDQEPSVGGGENARLSYLVLYENGLGKDGGRAPSSHALGGRMTGIFSKTCTRCDIDRSRPSGRPACHPFVHPAGHPAIQPACHPPIRPPTQPAGCSTSLRARSPTAPFPSRAKRGPTDAICTRRAPPLNRPLRSFASL